MPALYLHIGMAKTGTTSIQQFLTREQHYLDQTGFRYVRKGRIGLGGGHHCLAWALKGQGVHRPYCKQFSIDAFCAELDASMGKTVILSSEEFSLLSFERRALLKLFEMLRGYEVKVVVYVREQVDFFNSFYGELLSDLRPVLDTASAVTTWSHEERYNYSYWFEPWRECSGGNLIVRPFEPESMLGGSVVSDFVSTVGAGHIVSAARKFQEQNTSLTNKQVAALKGIISALEQEGLSRRNVCEGQWLALKRVVLGLVKNLKTLGGEPFWGVDADLAVTLRRRFHAANDAFFEQYYGKPFQFASVGKLKHVNEIKYSDLDTETRYIIERVITRQIEKLRNHVE